MGIGRLAPLLLVLLSTPACQAKEPAAVPQGSTRSVPSPVTAELISEHASIQPGGKTRIGVHIEIEEGWHIYANDPGDAGLPTKISWSANVGASFSELYWPTPQEFLDPGNIRTFGYSGTVVLYSTVHPHSWRETPSELTVYADVKWLACKDLCVPGSAQLELTLPVSDQPPVFSTHAQFFEQVQ